MSERISDKFRFIQVIINFADGEKMETFINADEGSFAFHVTKDCPVIIDLFVSAPECRIQPL